MSWYCRKCGKPFCICYKMKRYEFTYDSFDDRCHSMEESEAGGYVKYDDIKDDRALLEEAVSYIQELCDKLRVYNMEKYENFLKRAKERGVIG